MYRIPVRVSTNTQVLLIPTPGAARSTHGPSGKGLDARGAGVPVDTEAVVRQRPDQPGDPRAGPREVRRVVVGGLVILERHVVLGVGDEIPAVDVIHEAVMVVVHARQSRHL